MKHIKSFQLLEELETVGTRFPFTQFLIDELDRVGVEWTDVATPRQKKNGTAVIEFTLGDAANFYLNSGWIEKEPRKGVRTRLLNLKRKLAEYIENDKDLGREKKFLISTVNSIFPPNEQHIFNFMKSWRWSEGIESRKMRLYVHRNWLVDNHGDGPSSQVAVRWDPSDRASMEQALIDTLNREIGAGFKRLLRQAEHHSLDNYRHAFFQRLSNVMASISPTQAEIVLDEMLEIYGAQKIFDETKGELFKRIDISQAKFNELMRDDVIPEEVKAAILSNPYYSAPDDLLSDWF